jgi:hypothetical protein
MDDFTNDALAAFQDAAADDVIVSARLSVLDTGGTTLQRIADLVQTSGYISRDDRELAVALLSRLIERRSGRAPRRPNLWPYGPEIPHAFRARYEGDVHAEARPKSLLHLLLHQDSRPPSVGSRHAALLQGFATGGASDDTYAGGKGVDRADPQDAPIRAADDAPV